MLSQIHWNNPLRLPEIFSDSRSQLLLPNLDSLDDQNSSKLTSRISCVFCGFHLLQNLVHPPCLFRLFLHPTFITESTENIQTSNEHLQINSNEEFKERWATKVHFISFDGNLGFPRVWCLDIWPTAPAVVQTAVRHPFMMVRFARYLNDWISWAEGEKKHTTSPSLLHFILQPNGWL